jgi:hypothetical protein
MEPDVHSFVDSKLGWIGLPSNAKTVKGHYDHEKMWPKSSLKRLEICLARFEKAKKNVAAQVTKAQEQGLESIRDKDESPVDGDGEKTPTATGDVDDGEDDEAFERRFKETEKALQERLAKLSLKLEDEGKQTSSTAMA